MQRAALASRLACRPLGIAPLQDAIRQFRGPLSVFEVNPSPSVVLVGQVMREDNGISGRAHGHQGSMGSKPKMSREFYLDARLNGKSQSIRDFDVRDDHIG